MQVKQKKKKQREQLKKEKQEKAMARSTIKDKETWKYFNHQEKENYVAVNINLANNLRRGRGKKTEMAEKKQERYDEFIAKS